MIFGAGLVLFAIYIVVAKAYDLHFIVEFLWFAVCLWLFLYGTFVWLNEPIEPIAPDLAAITAAPIAGAPLVRIKNAHELFDVPHLQLP
jgi:hypothetical protein